MAVDELFRNSFAAFHRHGHDEARCGQPNRWFGADTCECLCGCAFVALGHYFDKPLCRDCAEREPNVQSSAGPDDCPVPPTRRRDRRELSHEPRILESLAPFVHPFKRIVSTSNVKPNRCRECGRLPSAHLTRTQARIAAALLDTASVTIAADSPAPFQGVGLPFIRLDR